jgi:response regulator RpfG family c-di-GMP phosphodiesterase
MMTAYGTVETAVEAMRAGAYDFVEKPLKRLQILKSVAKAMEKAGLVAENRTLREEISQLRKREIIGTSHALRQVLEMTGQAAPSMHPAPEIYDLLRRAIAYLQQAAGNEKALDHFERELCRILGVHDTAGAVTSQQGLASLGGGIPRSRAAAVSFLGKKSSRP